MKRRENRNLVMISFLVLCLCYMIPNYAQYQMSPLGMQILEQYHLQLPQLSSLFSAPMIPAIFFSFIGGLLMDRYGYKWIVCVGMCLASVGCVWRIVSGNYSSLFLAMLLTGFGACFINAAGGKIVGSLFTAEQVPAKMGILMAASTSAMTIANLTTAYFPSIKAAFMVSAMIAIGCVPLWIIFIRQPKQTQQASVSLNMTECLKKVGKNVSVWIIAFALFFIMAANVVMGSFLPTALSGRGISAVTAGNMAAFYTLGNLFGCFAAPMAINILKSQKKVLILFSIMAAFGIAFAWMIPNTILMGPALLLTGIFLGGMIPVLMGLPVQFTAIGSQYAGTAGGIIGTVQLLGAVILPSYVLAPVAGENFVMLFILGGICMIIAGILSGCIKEI